MNLVVIGHPYLYNRLLLGASISYVHFFLVTTPWDQDYVPHAQALFFSLSRLAVGRGAVL